MAQRLGRPCVVLYDSTRAVVVDVASGRWADALWALGVDDDAAEFTGNVTCDERADEVNTAVPGTPRAVPVDGGNPFDDAPAEELDPAFVRKLDEALEQLMGMGFERDRAAAALAATDGDLQQAVGRLL